MACHAVEHTQSSQNLLLAQMYISLTLSVIASVAAILVLLAVVLELWKFRKVIWLEEERKHEGKIDNEFYSARLNLEMELMSAAIRNGSMIMVPKNEQPAPPLTPTTHTDEPHQHEFNPTVPKKLRRFTYKDL